MQPTPAKSKSKASKRAASQVKLRPADPFELIRWLARSQPDPRKAVAELVQNSLDAGARHIRIERRRVRGTLLLSVRDDGEGVLPELEREAALHYLATHIGHSRKLGLDPLERHRRVIAGKYGVGLLGFWSVGRVLELRTRVRGSRPFVLRLEEESPKAEISPLAMRIDAAETFTEAVVLGIHAAAQRVLSGRRLADYLAAELRGQLLAREVDVVMHDGVARGTAQKTFSVVPQKFMGERIAVPEELEVPGHPPVRVELYLARGSERAAIQVACIGTLVADSIAELPLPGFQEAPWVGRELTGIVDFPSFNVPPGTRRGVVPDAAAEAFVLVMQELRSRIEGELERLDHERREAVDRHVVRDLRRALRGLQRRLPHYELPAVEGKQEPGDALPGEPLAEGADTKPPEAKSRPQSQLDWIPIGPLAEVRIVPERIELVAGTERRVRAVPRDAHAQVLSEAVAFRWEVAEDERGLGLEVRGEGPRPALWARPDAPLGAEARVRVIACADGREVPGLALVVICAPEDSLSGVGIPEPTLVSDAGGAWRSRMSTESWEVNDAHEDYLALRGEPRGRLRYLLMLLAKEIALQHSGPLEAADALESIVAILAHAERNLSRD